MRGTCLLTLAILFGYGLIAVIAAPVSISNVSPRLDTNGKILDAHDSKVLYVNETYYWFAASYGDCKETPGDSGCFAGWHIGSCGFRTDHNVTLYESRDLVTWTNRGVVFSATTGLPDNSVLFAPKTVFNPLTSTYVMWFNYIVNDFSKSYYGVATSPTPYGPFKLQVPNVLTLRYSDNGDENLFVDSDGTGYLIYTSLSQGHSMSIERLSPDYLSTLGATNSSGLIWPSSCVEAPMMFSRVLPSTSQRLYYVVFGGCCCYCEAGSQVTVYTAEHPLGPYTPRTSLGQLHSQSTDIFQFGGDKFMYVGDHWQSAPDGVKGHDFTVWAPLKFSSDGLSVTTDGFQSSFAVDV